MDGPQKEIGYSLQKKLSVSLALWVVGLGLLSGTYAYYAAKQEAIEWQDTLLLQVSNISQLNDQRNIIADTQQLISNEEQESNLYVVHATDRNNEIVLSQNVRLRLPKDIADGLHTFKAHNGQYRIAVKSLPKGIRLIIAQDTIERDELATDNAQRLALQVFALVFILILLLKRHIHLLIQPVLESSRIVDQFDYQRIAAIDLNGLPREIHPFIQAINQMLARTAKYVENQQRFIAEAAHELRTPLTALSLQSERLESMDMPQATKVQVATLREGIARNRALVEQLLALARVQSEQPAHTTHISLSMVIKNVIEQLMPLIVEKSIDIGAVELQEIYIDADELSINLLIKNLIENAIKYSPAEGTVDICLSMQDERPYFSIVDSGPGIDSKDIERIFDPFFRSSGTCEQGSGLGLSIVKLVADRLGAKLQLVNIRPKGLKVSVWFK